MKHFLFILAVLLGVGACNTPQTEEKQEVRDYIKTETSEEKQERMQWWRDAGFGMFIHWGLYAVPAGQYGEDTNHAEWIQETADITVEEYEKYADQFNPIQFNARQWVQIAKDAGMKYIVITSKHHDGFCLWDSKVSDYDIMDRTPYKKDILKALAEACEEEGIKLCFYHSIMDWHHPDAQGINHPDYNNGTGPNPNFSKYAEDYMKPQLEELLSNYGDIGVLWFDGEWISEWTEKQGKELYNHLRNIQPSLIINNRVGKGRQGMEGMNAYEDAAGDFGTPEQEILESGSNLDWESCMTMNGKWGFNKFDKNWKSAEMLIHNLIDIAAKGGNYLLNVGPTAEGLIPGESVSRLKEMGAWMKVNGEVIHNSRATKQFKESESVFYIRSKDDAFLYAVLTQWPGESVSLRYAVPAEESKIYMLGNKHPLSWTKNESGGITLELPGDWQNVENRSVKYAWVIKMKGQQAKVADAPEFIVESKVIEDKALFSDAVLVSLRTETEGAKIYYSIIEEGITGASKEYTEPIQLSKASIVTAAASKEGYVSSKTVEASFIQASTFKSIEFEHPYSEKYAAMGNFTLGDGDFGDEEKVNEKWLGFQEADVVASIDLGEEKSISNVSANFLQNVKSWIFLPEFVEISISIDRTNYTTISKVENLVPHNERKPLSNLFNASFSPKQARYVRISAKNMSICPEWHPGAGGKAWLFVDEIVIK